MFNTANNLSANVADHVRGMIEGGELSIGDRLNEVHLAEQMGISRTPLREGLTRLAEAGVLTTQARRGFFVPEFDAHAVGNLYGIRAILDPAALLEAGMPSGPRLSDLRTVNERLVLATTAVEVVALDNLWHSTLIAHCPNRELLRLIDQYASRTRVFELELCRRSSRVVAMVTDHAAVLDALERDDLTEAVRLLRTNLEQAPEALEHFLG